MPTPPSCAKGECDCPPITGSFMTCHGCAIFRPSKVARTTGSAVSRTRATRWRSRAWLLPEKLVDLHSWHTLARGPHTGHSGTHDARRASGVMRLDAIVHAGVPTRTLKAAQALSSRRRNCGRQRRMSGSSRRQIVPVVEGRLLRGTPLRCVQHVFYLLHKPAGHLSQRHPCQANAYELIPAGAARRRPLPAVGRLDHDTTGLCSSAPTAGCRRSSPSDEEPRVEDVHGARRAGTPRPTRPRASRPASSSRTACAARRRR